MTTKPINSQIEELKEVIDKVPKSAFRTGLTRLQIKKIYNMGFQKGKQEAQKEFRKMIEKEFKQLDFVTGFRPFINEDDFLEWFNDYRRVRLKELKSQLIGDKR